MSTKKILSFSLVGLGLVLVLFNLPLKKHKNIQKSVLKEEIIEVSAATEIETLPYTAAEVAEEVVSLAKAVAEPLQSISDDAALPKDVDRMAALFQPYPPTLPIVKTVSYSGRVDWLTGRAAYLGDYASHYQTSKHFISRSLHGMGNYLSDVVSTGDRFNVYCPDKEIEFHLVLDLSRLKIWLYYFDKDDNIRQLLKSYYVCAGRLDSSRISGCLTPTGTFLIGNDVAVNQPGGVGNFKNETREVITVFGVRWIPLAREIANCTGSSKGLGLHGVPWKRSSETHELQECRECIGNYESSGCIRLLSEDIEEIYSVIVAKPTYIHIVRDFTEAQLPGKDLDL